MFGKNLKTCDIQTHLRPRLPAPTTSSRLSARWPQRRRPEAWVAGLAADRRCRSWIGPTGPFSLNQRMVNDHEPVYHHSQRVDARELRQVKVRDLTISVLPDFTDRTARFQALPASLKTVLRKTLFQRGKPGSVSESWLLWQTSFSTL